MEVAIVGEDQATREILNRLINHVGGIIVKQEFPARGGRIKSLVPNFNNLSLTRPVLLLTDLDQFSCAPELLSEWFRNSVRNPDFHVRVAVDEAEAWLMADREGFSRYFEVPLDLIPNPIVRSRLKPHIYEMNFPFKSSFYLMTRIIPHSRSKTIRENLLPKSGAKKGILYNSTIVPFIQNHWNIDSATRNSYSLRSTITRFEEIRL